MKTKEELNTLKEEVESVSRKLTELNKEDLETATGGEIQTDECPCRYGFQSANKQCFKKRCGKSKIFFENKLECHVYGQTVYKYKY